MADVNTPDASVATNASNKTQYFDLPLFIATDKPSWLVDWNGAMNEIDKILNDIATASEGAVADVATIQTQINTLSTTVTSLNGIVDTAVQDVAAMQTTVESHETRMDTIEGDLITQNNLIKALSTSVTTMQGTVASLNTAVESMQTTLAGYDSRITGAEDAATAAQTAVAGIQSTVQSLSSTVAGHTTQISGLDGRVTALEQGGTGGGVPFISDLTFTEHGTNLTQATTGSSGTAFTATNDCLVYFRTWITLAYQGSDIATKTLGTRIANTINQYTYVSSAPYTGATSYAFENGYTSPLYKLKAGETITYSCTGTWGDGGASNLTVYEASL